MDDRGGRARGDRNSEDDGSPSGGVRALLIEALRTLTGEWRAIIIAIIGALIGLLLADLLGDSDNATTLAAVLGAAAGTWLKGLADRLRWRERTLTGIGGVLGLLALPRPRTWILEQARSAAVNTASPTSTIAALMSGTLVTAIGAATVLVVEPIVDGRAGGARAGLELAADFERVQGRRVSDSSGKDHGGTLRGDASIVDGGREGRAVAFSGSEDQAVDFGDVLDLTDGVTVEAWAKQSGTPQGWDTVVSNWDANRGYWLGGSVSPGGFEWWIDEVHADVDTGVAPGEWRHLAGTFEASSGQLVLYVGGEAVTTARHPGKASISDSNLQLGTGGGEFNPWTGLIDDVRIWHSVRTAEQICGDAGGRTTGSSGCRL